MEKSIIYNNIREVILLLNHVTEHDLKYCLEHVKPEPLCINRQSLVQCLHELSLAKCSQLIVNGFISEEIDDMVSFICSS